jgi:hypothetical protein
LQEKGCEPEMTKNAIIGLLAATSFLAGAVAVDQHWKLQAARLEMQAPESRANVASRSFAREVPPPVTSRQARVERLPQEPAPEQLAADLAVPVSKKRVYPADPDHPSNAQQFAE